jgi:1-acyl-sn-glycerol-3-phosphate acyltransferase
MQKFWQVTRSIYIWSAIGFGTAVMYAAQLPVFLLSRPFDRNRRFGHWYATVWGRGILKLNNRWVIYVKGNERIPKGRPLVVVSNHQSMGDICMAFCLDLHFKWISKKVNFQVPFMGWMMYHAGYIPLVRGHRGSIEKCMEQAGTWLKRGVSVLFFPEGTRSQDGNIKAFKPGAFSLALKTGCDILPVAMTGTMDALPKHSWLFPDEYAHMKVSVGDPISIADYKPDEIDRLIEDTRQAITALKDDLDGKAAPAVPLKKAS